MKGSPICSNDRNDERYNIGSPKSTPNCGTQEHQATDPNLKHDANQKPDDNYDKHGFESKPNITTDLLYNNIIYEPQHFVRPVITYAGH